MGISCSCDGDYESWYIPDADLAALATRRTRRCASCGERIPVGAQVLRLSMYRAARCDYEVQRYPDGVPMADKYYCEDCAEIYQTLTQTGMCISLGDMRETLREYWQITGFDPEKYKESDHA